MAISVKSQIEYTKIKSKFFICVKCLDYMIEWTPVIKAAYRHGLKRMIQEDLGGQTPRTWLQCPNGHPRFTGFYDLREKQPRRRTTL